MCVQDARQRDAVVELIGGCRKRTGWPTLSLGEELRAFWESESAANG